MRIGDGKGRGYEAAVNDDNHLQVTAVIETEEHYVNHVKGKAFHCLFEQAPTANDDCIFYMENGSEEEICIEGITFYVSAACEIYVKLDASGTRNGATLCVPANCNTASGRAAIGTFEKGADLDGGAATLVDGHELERFKFIAETQSFHYNFEQDLMLQQNTTLTIWCDTAGVTVLATVVFNYQTEHE